MEKIDFDKLGIPGMVPNETKTAGYLMVGAERLMVFINDTGDLDIAIDELSEKGHFDENLEWIVLYIEDEPSIDDLYTTARKETVRMMSVSIARQVNKSAVINDSKNHKSTVFCR